MAAPLVNGNGVTSSLVKAGPGTMMLSAINTYTGGTTVSDGTLDLGPGTGPGAARSAAR